MQKHNVADISAEQPDANMAGSGAERERRSGAPPLRNNLTKENSEERK